MTLYIHEEIEGCLGNIDSRHSCSQSWFDGFGAVLVGHIHNRMRLQGTSIEYIGSSRQNNFGEDEEKGYTIFFDDGSYEFVKNEVNARFANVELDYNEIDSVKNLEYDKRYKVKLKLHCTDSQAKLVDRNKLLEFVDKVELITGKTKAVEANESDIMVRFDKNGIIKEYIKVCNDKGVDSKLGVEYLQKIC